MSLPDVDRPTIVFVCTGNAARSVMARVMFSSRCDRFVATGGGTFAIEGQPMSVRTRNALGRHGLADPHHRSTQLWAVDARRAALLVTMAPEHVLWVRRHIPEVAARTATLRRLVKQLEPGDARPLADRLAALALAEVALEDWEEVVDPRAASSPTSTRARTSSTCSSTR